MIAPTVGFPKVLEKISAAFIVYSIKFMVVAFGNNILVVAKWAKRLVIVSRAITFKTNPNLRRSAAVAQLAVNQLVAGSNPAAGGLD